MSKSLVLRRLWTYFKSNRSGIIISFIFSAVSAVIGILLPYLAGRAIDCIGDNDADIRTIVRILLFMVLLIVASSVCQFVQINVNNKIIYSVTGNIRNDAYGKISRLPISFLDSYGTGSLQSMIISDCETAGDGLLMFMNQFVSGLVSIFMTLIIMFAIDWRIALFVIIFTPVSFAISYSIASKTYSSFKKQSKIRADQTSYVSEMTGNFKTIYAYNTTESVCDGFDKINSRYRRVSARASFLSSVTNPSTRFVNALIYAGVAFIGAHQVLKAILSVGALSSMLAYASNFMKPFNELSSVYTEMNDSFACLSRIFEYLEEEELDDELLAECSDGLWAADKDFSIEFRHVSFSYIPGRKVLDDVSFIVESGNSCAIVGPTGCGKTTIINLLLRFYEPDSGQILVNGINIADIPRNTLRQYIGIVTQDTWFYNGTILDNIRYANGQMTEEEAENASKLSGADSFIRKLKDRYNEVITSGREDISEGQRQLLSITRAMAGNPSMLILDEATSSVDIVTEYKIQHAVKELLQRRTSIIIAHRLSTIVDASLIVVIENGRVSETGNHEFLINKGGFYSKLYKSYIE